MKPFHLLTVSILILSLVLTGCYGRSVETQSTPGEGQLIDSAEEDFNKLSEEKKEEQRKARAEEEARRKAEAGEFYVPLPALGQEPVLRTVKARALYLTANVAGFDFSEEDIAYYAEYIRTMRGKAKAPADTSRMDEINKLEKALGICEATEINALVIDIKNDDGVVTWKSDTEIVNQVGSNSSSPFENYEKLMNYLTEKDIYPIARIVAFKDPYFAEIRSEHAIRLKAGGVYRDHSGKMWVNPFDEYVWKYLLAISKEAALRGFAEIQYDYVRFPDGAKTYNPITEFPGRNDRDKDEGIEEFLKYAKTELEPYRVRMSADVFGIITHSWDDKPEDIGQTWRKIANQVDYICPMIYPSHYGTRLYGFAVPDQHPYEVVRSALLEAIERNAAQKKPGTIRPWVQGFNASWVKGHINYDAETISAQLAAAMELGIDEYIVWNASNHYDPMTFFYHDRIDRNIRQEGEDILSRTPQAALDKYLDAEKNRRYSLLYLLTPITERQEDYDAFAAEAEKNSSVLKSYKITGIDKNEDGSYSAAVEAVNGNATGSGIKNEVLYKIILENEVYKVIRSESDGNAE